MNRLATARRRGQLVAYLLVVVVGAAGFWRMETTVHRLDNVIRDNQAQQCENAWEGRRQIREAIPVPGEAIIAVSPDADPAKVAEFRQVVDRAIKEKFPDPDCDLAAAKRRLG